MQPTNTEASCTPAGEGEETKTVQRGKEGPHVEGLLDCWYGLDFTLCEKGHIRGFTGKPQRNCEFKSRPLQESEYHKKVNIAGE